MHLHSHQYKNKQYKKQIDEIETRVVAELKKYGNNSNYNSNSSNNSDYNSNSNVTVNKTVNSDGSTTTVTTTIANGVETITTEVNGVVVKKETKKLD